MAQPSTVDMAAANTPVIARAPKITGEAAIIRLRDCSLFERAGNAARAIMPITVPGISTMIVRATAVVKKPIFACLTLRAAAVL